MILTAAIAATVPLVSLLRAPIQGQDEGILLVHSEEVMSGRQPHGDFATVYGPMTYWTLALVFRLFEPSLYAERLVGAGYRLVLALALALLLRRSVGAGAAAAAASLSLLMQAVSVPLAYGYYGALACTVSGLAVLASQRGPAARMAGGALIGLSSSFRPEMAILALAAVPLLLKGGKRPALVGWALGLSPMALHTATASAGIYRDVLRGRAALNAQVAWLSPLLMAGVVALAMVIVAALYLARRDRDTALAAAGVLCLLLLPQTLQRLDVSHFLLVASVVLPVGLARALRGVTLMRSGLGAWAAPVVGIMAAVMAVAFVLPQASPTVSRQGRTLHVAPAQVATVNRLLAAVDEVAEERATVFVGAQDMSKPILISTWLYHLMPDRPIPFRYVEFQPGSTERRGSGLAEDIDNAEVLVLEDLGELARVLTPNAPPGDQEANERVARDFCSVRTVGEFEVFVRRPKC